MTLLGETLKKLHDEGYEPGQVVAIFDRDGHRVTWGGFTQVSDREYNSSFGVENVRKIFILLDDGAMLYRMDYDGSEWWEYIPPVPNAEPLTDSRDIEGFVWTKYGWDDDPCIDDYGDWRGDDSVDDTSSWKDTGTLELGRSFLKGVDLN